MKPETPRRTKRLWSREPGTNANEYFIRFEAKIAPKFKDVSHNKQDFVLTLTDFKGKKRIERTHYGLARAFEDGEMELHRFLDEIVKKLEGEIVWKPWRP